MSAYQQLVQHYQHMAHFSHLAAICHWDQAAMMPAGGNQARSEAMATLSVHIHQLATAPKLDALLKQAAQEKLAGEDAANLREMTRAYQQATLLPNELVNAKSLAGAKCEHAWRTQRANNDWQGFSANLAEVVTLSQQEAKLRAQANNLTPYDAMLDLYEPGITSKRLDNLFADLKSWLPDLTQEVLKKQQKEKFIAEKNDYATDAQHALGLEVMKLLGFDFNHGRLDISTHPFCGGVSQDVRITTRYNSDNFQQSLMGIIHETGHARYEQGLPAEFAGQPVGLARSMGIHESQSLFFEMQLGRSPAFIDQLAPLIASHFPAQANVLNPAYLQQLYTRVKPDFIRVDADELTYPAHIILRYEIERDLINANITLNDIPELWDQKMQQYLGLSTQGNYKEGCMQDIHWTDGAFGYFPSYTLGAMYAAQLMASIKRSIDVDKVIQSGDLSPIFNWLHTHIWRQGSALSTDELITQATGEALNPEHFKQHLIARYL